MVWQDRSICHGFFHDEFLVAPEEWPQGIAQSWGLKEPPTPYEVACAILIEPAPGFWQLAKGADPLSMSVTYWWLAGLHEEVIITLLGQGKRALIPEDLYVLMGKFIRHAMTKGRFALWALGTNPIPACTTRHLSRAALALLEGKPMTRRGGHNGGNSHEDKKALEKLLTSPYITGQLKSGVRLAPIGRPLYKEGVVWENLPDKMEWLATENPGGKFVSGAKQILKEYPEQHPVWLRLSYC